jgi:hypothetical protein
MSASPSPAEQPSGKTYGELFADATQKVSKHQQQSIDWIGRKYLDGVGWCIQQSSWSSVPSNTNQHPQERSDYLILFNDGSQLLVESPESAKSAACFLRFSPNHSQQPLRYKIDKDLPTLIKTRLANFPHFIQLYDA